MDREIILTCVLFLLPLIWKYYQSQPYGFRKDIIGFFRFIVFTMGLAAVSISMLVHFWIAKLQLAGANGRAYLLMALASAVCCFITYSIFSGFRDLKKLI